MTDIIKELFNSKIINVSCDNVSELLDRLDDMPDNNNDNNTLLKILINSLFRDESTVTRIDHFSKLVKSCETKHIHYAKELYANYMPIIIKDLMNYHIHYDGFVTTLHLMIDYIFTEDMKNTIDDVFQIICDTYQTLDEPPRIMIEMILYQKHNFGPTLLSKLLKLEEPEECLLICRKNHILFRRVFELIQLYHPAEDKNYVPDKEADYLYMSKYDDILKILVENNNDIDSEDCFFGILDDVAINNVRYVFCAKYVYKLYDTSFRHRITHKIYNIN